MGTIIQFPPIRAHTASAPPAFPFTDAIALFLVDLQVAGRRLLTCKRHGGELRRFGRWLDGQNTCWIAVTDDQIAAYLRTRAQLTPSTQSATVGSLRRFYAWSVARRYMQQNPAADLTTPRRPKPTPKALTRMQLRRLLAELDRQQGRRAQRDAALVLTGLYAGLRAAELADLCWSDVDLDAEVITIGLSKMGHGRGVAIHPDLVARLRQWRDVQGLGDDAPCFADVRHGTAISPARVGKIVRGVARATGIALHTHRLRHSFATWTLRESGDLYAVSKALGHKALKQTEIYIPVSADIHQIAAAVGRLPGVADW